jgi:putative aldouronate transport system substrate-binding protein
MLGGYKMKKTLFKLLCICLITVLISSTLMACGRDTGVTPTDTPATAAPQTPDEPSEEPAETVDPIKFTIWTGNADPGDFVDEDPVHQYIREVLGVDIELQYTATDATEQLTLMLTSSSYPDALHLKPEEIMDNYITGGHLVEVGPYLEKHAPWLYEYMASKPSAFSLGIEDYSGRFFYVPGSFGYTEDFPCIEPSLGFRYDVWRMLAEDPADLPKPKDLDEFFEMAKAMQEAFPEYDGRKTYAFSGWFGDDWGAVWSVYAIQRFGGSHAWVGSATQADNWKQKYCFDSEEWMWGMRYLNRAYREGIADPEAVTMTMDEYNQKLAQGIVLINYYSGGWLDGVANRARAAAGFPEQKLVPYTWMKYPESSGITAEPITGQYFPNGMTGLYITVNCEDPEEIIKRLAWLSTEEGIAFQGMGVEDVHWTYDEDGFRKPTDEIIEMVKNDPDYIEKTGIGKYGIFSNYYGGFDSKGDAYTILENKYYLAESEDEYDLEYKEILGLDPNLTVEFNAARAGMTRDDEAFLYETGIEPGSDLASIESQLFSMQAEYIGKLYLAKDDAEFDKIIDEWRTKAENINYMDYYNHINPIIEAAYLEYLAGRN